MDTTVQVYAKSWVFEGTGEEAYHQPGESSSASICSSTTPTHGQAPSGKNKKGHSSKLSDANSERFNTQMSSFSRCATPSPIPHSGQATPTNAAYPEYAGVGQRTQKLNRLTVNYIQSVDPSIAPDATVVTPTLVASSSAAPKYTTKTNIQSSNGPSSISSQQDDSQYASMLAELELSLIEKKIQATNLSPDDTSLTASTDKFGSSKSSSKDLEFSKELEAALQLIQDLETPSEGPTDGVHSAAKVARSESEKTLSAALSLPSPEQAPYKASDDQVSKHGKHDDYRRTNVVHIEPNSQSTSGYSSPNSFSSNARLSHASSGISTTTQDSVYTDDQTNVVRIYIEQTGSFSARTPPPPPPPPLKTKSHESIEKHKQSTDSTDNPISLHKKRPMLHSDFQNRIFKSECLAYLTDEELIARHKCNRDIIRVREQSQAVPL